MLFFKNKKGKIQLDLLAWLILGVFILVILVAVVILFKDEISLMIDKIIDAMRFRRI